MEDIIRLFNANETNFDHNETILTDVLSFESEVEENGISYCEMTCPLDERIEEGKILKAPTPIGEQLFRIIKINKNLPAMTLYVYGRHISYDLLNNMLLNIRPTDSTQQNALNTILSGTEYPHPFTAQSDVPGLNTANYVRMNPIQAIMGADNSALTLWGGFLRRDNFLIKVLATSPDKGYEVRFGKNLLGVDEELDMTDVVTRLYPTVVIQEPTVTALPEKYVDSPLINSYPKPIIKEYRITLTDEEKLLTLAQIYTLMRARCAEQWTLKADQPKVNYKVDFVELRKTEQYKNFAVLEELDISDTVWAYVSPLNLNMSARMIKYRHDGLNDRYLSMELGNFKPKLTSQKAEFVKLVKDATKDLTDGVITAMLKDAVDRIQGNLGGNVVTLTANGKPVATAYMDTADVATANEYVIINNKGIAFGVNGLNNPPELAIDIDGSVVGNSAFFRSITTNLIQSELGKDLVLTSNTAITNLVSGITALDGRLGTAEQKITPTAITQTVEGNTTVLASKAEMKLVDDAWKLRFDQQIIGTANLLTNSGFENGFDGWIPNSANTLMTNGVLNTNVDGSAANLLVTAPASEPSRGVYRVYEKFEIGKEYTLSASVFSDDDYWIGTFAGSKSFLAHSEWRRVSVTFTANAPSMAIFFVFQNSATTSEMYIDNVKLEIGNVATGWTPHADEIYAGIFSADRDGWKIGRSDSKINMRALYNGFRIFDGEKERMFVGESGSYIPELGVDSIRGDLINTLPAMSFNIGTTQAYKTITEVMQFIGSRKHLLGNIALNIYESVNDIANITGFGGTGNIDINMMTNSNYYGMIDIYNNACRVTVTGGAGVLNATVPNRAIINAYGNTFILFSGLLINGSGLAGVDGIGVSYGIAQVSNCDITNIFNCLAVSNGGIVFANGNRGNGTSSFFVSNGALYNNGTTFVGSQGNYGHYITNGTITPTASLFSPPAPSSKTFRATFKAKNLITFIRGTSTVAGTYGSKAAQGKTSEGSIWTEGRITFGTDVANYWQGGTAISVRMRLHRYNSSHGLSAACKPDPDNFLAGGQSVWPTGGAIRGGWSEWATISSAEFSTTANKEFRFYSGVLDSGYAIWDDAEVEVTVTKNV